MICHEPVVQSTEIQRVGIADELVEEAMAVHDEIGRHAA